MKATKFKEANITLAKNQPEYLQLPALAIDGSGGCIVTCWRLNWWERLRVVFTGRVWMNTMTFKQSFHPVLLSTKRKDVYSLPGDTSFKDIVSKLKIK